METEYISKVYNGANVDLTNIDKKIIKALELVHAEFASDLEKRNCNVFYVEQENREPVILPEKNTVFESSCKAIKKDGQQCPCKSKPGEEFCGRHNKNKKT